VINKFKHPLKVGSVTVQYLLEKQHWNLLVGILLRIRMWVLRYVSMGLSLIVKNKSGHALQLHGCFGDT
jgi:hypothetical protein